MPEFCLEYLPANEPLASPHTKCAISQNLNLDTEACVLETEHILVVLSSIHTSVKVPLLKNGAMVDFSLILESEMRGKKNRYSQEANC